MTDWFNEHLLTTLILMPIAAAGVLALVRRESVATVQRLALGASLAILLFAVIGVAGGYFKEQPLGRQQGDVALNEQADWIVDSFMPVRLRIQYKLGLDGISLPLVLLTALLTPLAVLASFHGIRQRAKEYYIHLMLLHAAMLGVFCARDLLLFYIFFEFTLVPLYFIIAIWGGPERRRAANTFFIYTLAGSLLTFAGMLYLGYLGFSLMGERQAVFSFDMDQLNSLTAAGLLTPAVQWWLFLAFFAGFAIKVPIFPLHTWLPLAHTEAPTAGSAILAGVLLKLGTYGFLRVSLPLLPDASVEFAPFIATLAIVGIIYGALAAWVQRDVKKLVAYSSVSHLGFCMLGMFSMTMPGLTGSLLYMVNHGLSTAALFFVVGMFYERYHTRDIDKIGGLARKMPIMAFFLVVFTLSSIGLPGTNGFISEFLVLLGTFISNNPRQGGFSGPLGVPYALLAATGVMLGAIYMLHMVRCVLFGPIKEPDHGYDPACGLPQDLNAKEIGVLAPIAVLCLVIGFVPKPLFDVMQPALQTQALAKLHVSPSMRTALQSDAGRGPHGDRPAADRAAEFQSSSDETGRPAPPLVSEAAWSGDRRNAPPHDLSATAAKTTPSANVRTTEGRP